MVILNQKKRPHAIWKLPFSLLVYVVYEWPLMYSSTFLYSNLLCKYYIEVSSCVQSKQMSDKIRISR